MFPWAISYGMGRFFWDIHFGDGIADLSSSRSPPIPNPPLQGHQVFVVSFLARNRDPGSMGIEGTRDKVL